MSKFGPWAFNVSICSCTDSDLVYNSMPQIESFLCNSTRYIMIADLFGMNSVRMLVNKQSISGAVGSKIYLKYSENYSTNLYDYKNIGESPVEVSIDTENAFLKTEWIPLLAPQNDVYLAVIGSGGDGIISPHFGNIVIDFA